MLNTLRFFCISPYLDRITPGTIVDGEPAGRGTVCSSASTGLWEPRVGNDPGPSGPTHFGRSPLGASVGATNVTRLSVEPGSIGLCMANEP